MNKFDPAAYLTGLNINVMHFGLTTISRLLLRLGNPHHSYPSILIAGTNGKGSTAAMIASILQNEGYRTGLYTSPHLVDVRERIVINGSRISRRDFSRILGAVAQKVDRPATYFEVLTAVAFLYFQLKRIDIAVLEVGMGGRLDATNVCRPLVSIITNIGFDHREYLGNTLTAIAREKAGIIKKKGICVSAARQKKVIELFRDICRRRRAAFYELGRDFGIIKQNNGRYSYQGRDTLWSDLVMPLTGSHQLDNAALALAAVEIAGQKGFPVSAESVRNGLKKTNWEARLEILQKKPLFVLDGAHNPAGISALCRTLKSDFKYGRMILIFGVLDDKDYRRMFSKIMPLASEIILPQLKTTRALPANDICAYVKNKGYRAETAENVTAAVRRALDIAGDDDMICAAGSLYLAGEIKQIFC